MSAVTVAIDADLQRLRGEFLAMPGLCLTIAQVARLLGVSVKKATALLVTLEEERFLVRVAGGVYRRAFPFASP